MKKLLALLLCGVVLLLALSACSGEEPDTEEDASASQAEPPEDSPAPGKDPEEEPPGYLWEFDLPENHGVDGAVLERLHAALAESEVYSMVLLRHGVIIDEYYGEGCDETTVFRLASCSKSFTGALIGIAIEQGLIADVDEPISAYLTLPENSGKEGITIRHLLEHTSGIEWYEWGADHSTFREFTGSEDWVAFVLGRNMAAEPGTVFNYTTGGPHLLAAILQQAAGESALAFGQRHLFGPLAMDSVEWRDHLGITDGGNGISMTARDAAKFGQLYLNGGSWEGVQVVPASWVERSTTRQTAGAGGNSGAYGYQWWLRPFGDGGHDTYYAMGHGGQFIFVVPELDLVTVMTSSYADNTYAPWPYFTDYILAACT